MVPPSQLQSFQNVQGPQHQKPYRAQSEQRLQTQQQEQHQQNQTTQQQQHARLQGERLVTSAVPNVIHGRPWKRGPVAARVHAAHVLQGPVWGPGSGLVVQPPAGADGQPVLLASGKGPAPPAEPLQVTVLGAGQDVGRSAVYIRRGERGLLFDCGSHLGAKQSRKLPALNMLLQLTPQQKGQDMQTMEDALLQPSPLFATCTDAAVISHFHMDHCGSLPSFTERLGYRNPITMTYPTRALSPVLLLDSARIFKEAAFRARQQHLQETDSAGRETRVSGNNSGDGRGGSAGAASQESWNYTEGEAQRSMRRCVALRLHESWETAGWTVTPYYAGHVLGAAMLHAQLPGGLSVVYTGDFNTAPDRHLGSASIPRLRPDLLISECTYGSFVRPSKRITEREFCDAVHDALKKGGKVLIPVFAVGRAQELCMLLNSYWQRMQLQYPIYFGGGMTEKANKYYKLYVQWTGSDLAHRLDNANTRQNAFADHIEADDAGASDADCGAFNFSHISTLPPDVLTAPTPMVLLATPGMLHGGLALKALKLWADGPENLVLLPGYCVRGTIGAMLIDGQRDIPLDARTRLKVLCKVRYMSFSAHADTTGIQQLARHLQPKAVMLVHGEKEGMLKLARVLQRELGVPVYTPPTGQTVSVPVDQTEDRIPVYVHNECFRRPQIAARGSGTPLTSPCDSMWECDDEGRYFSHSVAHGQTVVVSSDALSPYFLPAASLLFRISAADDEQATVAGATRKGNSAEGFCEGKRDLRRDLYMLIDFRNLLSKATALTINGCGSLAHSTGGSLPLTEDNTELMHAAGSSSEHEHEQKVHRNESNKDGSIALSAQSITADAEPIGLPRCLQLVAPRYCHDLVIPFPAFQQLLHLFMQYLVQCRQAYEQLRLQRGPGEDVAANSALAAPDFCDFGYELKLREPDVGGIILEFLSLIAIHDGNDRLFIQWGDADERRRGAASVFVEYFESVAVALPAANVASKTPSDCRA